MLDRLFLVSAWIVGALIVWFILKKTPTKFFHWILVVLTSISAIVTLVVAPINWIIVGNMDWTMGYPILIVIIDIVFMVLLFLSYAIRNNKDEQDEIL
jgi:uncharacterized protein YacL